MKEENGRLEKSRREQAASQKEEVLLISPFPIIHSPFSTLLPSSIRNLQTLVIDPTVPAEVWGLWGCLISKQGVLSTDAPNLHQVSRITNAHKAKLAEISEEQLELNKVNLKFPTPLTPNPY